jgi:hypothetical protein
MIDLTLPSALALVAGFSVVMQQVLNANLLERNGQDS